MKILIISLGLALISTAVWSQNNLLDTSTWTEGTGSSPGFTKYGPTASSVREMDTGPNGESTLIWKAKAGGTSDSDGGFSTNYFPISDTKKYRLTVWLKLIGTQNGLSYFGLQARDDTNAYAVTTLSGANRNNAYFNSSVDLPNLDEWFLYVGYVHPSTHSGTAYEGRIYRTDGSEVTGRILPDYKFKLGASQMRLRSFLRKTDVPDEHFIFDPTVYEVNGNEPSVQDVITAATLPPTNGTSIWNTSGSAISYTAGSVGIGTTSPDEALTVKGKVHTEEVRVDLSVPAPDYVFKDDYQLLSLSEIQDHINTHGHLPNIPSAKEMETDGVELGRMEMKLLEKIEELTLYILAQEKRINALEEQNKTNK